MIKPKRVHHLAVFVSDLKRSVQFYTDIVGMKVRETTDTGFAFLCTDTYHHCLGLIEHPRGARPSQRESGHLHHFALELENREELLRAVEFLKGKGVEIVRGPGEWTGAGSHKDVFFLDPDGNWVEFFCEMDQVPLERLGEPPRHSSGAYRTW